MQGKVNVTKKFTLELNEQEMNSVFVAIAVISSVRLKEAAAGEGVTVLANPDDLHGLYKNLKFLSTGK